jgi:hypothetical protein
MIELLYGHKIRELFVILQLTNFNLQGLTWISELRKKPCR